MSKSKVEKLTGMIGKHWQNKSSRRQNIYHFLSMKVDGDKIYIATDKDWLETTVFDISVFMEQFEQVEMGLVVSEKNNPINSPVASPLANDTMTNLKETLLDNIKKVKADKSYIPQAKEISNTVNTLINLASLEIKMRGGRR